MYKNHLSTDKACGGVALLIKDGIPHSNVLLKTPLQATCAKVTMNKKAVSVCSLYILPTFPLKLSELNNLKQQLPEPFLILGDFNGHSKVWGCKDTNEKGTIIENFLAENDLNVFLTTFF